VLASPGARRVEGAFDTLAELALEDVDERVRAAACLQLVEADAGKAPAAIAAIIAGTERGSKTYRSCLHGLMHLWAHAAEPSEPAYRASLEHLERAADWHDWLEVAQALVGPRTERLQDRAWFQAAPLIELIAGVIREREADASLREKGVETLVELGAPRELLAELLAGYADAEGRDEAVGRALAAVIDAKP
jgi:hypothetical protein